MSCARALSLLLLQLAQLLLQVGRAGLVAVLVVAGLPILWVTGALFRVKLARFAGVIVALALAAALAPLFTSLVTSACRRRC